MTMPTAKPRIPTGKTPSPPAAAKKSTAPANPDVSFWLFPQAALPGLRFHRTPGPRSSLPRILRASHPRLNRFVLRVTNAFQIAFHALRLARRAYPPPMPDQLMRELDPLFLRQNGHQVLLNFFRILLARQIQPVGQPDHVRIHHYSARDSVRRAQHHVPGLSRHSRQRKTGNVVLGTA